MHDDGIQIPNTEQQPPPPPDAPEHLTNGTGQHLTRRRPKDSFFAADRAAELALLGCILNGADPTIIDLAAWTIPGAQAVHHAALQLANGKPLDVDLVTRAVGNEVDRFTFTDDHGTYTGRHAIGVASISAPATYHAPRYAAIVAEQHRLRVLALHVANAEQALLDADADQVVEHLSTAITTTVETATATSWHAIDLTGILAGNEPPQPPTLLHRTDGHALFYSGKVNALNAESETAKTWLALWACAEEIDAGHHAVYIDFEDTAHTAVERLLGYNLAPDQIAEHLHYLRPDDPFDRVGQAALEQLIADTDPTIVVIDGVTEAMHLHGLSLLDNDDIARFYALLPRRIASHGPGVIDIDHVPKDTTNRKGGIGGQHKRAGVDGAILLLEPHRPFGRGLHGIARIHVDKDRPGHVRSISHEGKVAGELHLDATGTDGRPHLYVQAIDITGQQQTWDGPTQCMAAVGAWFTANPHDEVSQRQAPERLAAAGVTYRAQTVRNALERLTLDGILTARTGPRNARLYRLNTVQPSEPDEMF